MQPVYRPRRSFRLRTTPTDPTPTPGGGSELRTVVFEYDGPVTNTGLKLAEVQFNKDFILSLQCDDTLKEGRQLALTLKAAGAPKMTDGTGQEVFYRLGFAINAINGQLGVEWGSSPEQFGTISTADQAALWADGHNAHPHGYTHGLSDPFTPPGGVVGNVAMMHQWLFDKFGLIARYGVRPNNDLGYHPAWKAFGNGKVYLGSTSTGDEPGMTFFGEYYKRPAALEDIGTEYAFMHRWFDDFNNESLREQSIANLSNLVKMMVEDSTATRHCWMQMGMHNCIASMVVEAFQRIKLLAGDRLLVMPGQRVLEYRETRQLVKVVSDTTAGNKRTLVLDYGICSPLASRNDLTLIGTAEGAKLTKVTVSGGTMSCTFNPETGLVNLFEERTFASIDGRPRKTEVVKPDYVAGIIPVASRYVDLNTVPKIDLRPLFTDDLEDRPVFRRFLNNEFPLNIKPDVRLEARADYIEVRDENGSAAEGGVPPLDIYAIEECTGERLLLGQFTGSGFGVYQKFYLPTPDTRISDYGAQSHSETSYWFTKIRAVGRYRPVDDTPPALPDTLVDEGYGVVLYPYDASRITTENPTGNKAISSRAGTGVHAGAVTEIVDLIALLAARTSMYLNFNAVRAWKNLNPYTQEDVNQGYATAAQLGTFRSVQGSIRMHVTRDGAFYVTDFVRALKERGTETVFRFINTPKEIARTWFPAGTPDDQVDDDTVPYAQGTNPLDINNYPIFEEFAEQITGTYGFKTHPVGWSKFSTVKVAGYDPDDADTINRPSGMGLCRKYAFRNEGGKYWKGLKSRTTPEVEAMVVLALRRGMDKGDPASELIGPDMYEFEASDIYRMYAQWWSVGAFCPCVEFTAHSYSMIPVLQPDGSYKMRGVPIGETELRQKMMDCQRAIAECHAKEIANGRPAGPAPKLRRSEGGIGESINGESSPDATPNTSVQTWKAILTTTDTASDLTLNIGRDTYQLAHDDTFLANPNTDSTKSDISCGVVNLRTATPYLAGRWMIQKRKKLAGYSRTAVVQNPSFSKEAPTIIKYTKPGAPDAYELFFCDNVERTHSYGLGIAEPLTRWDYTTNTLDMQKTAEIAAGGSITVSHIPCLCFVRLLP